MTRLLCATVCACAILSATSASAQLVDPSEMARFRFGALRFTPSLVINNAGVDTNVFNQVVNPKQDTVAAIGPQADMWLKVGSGWLTLHPSVQYLYYATYDNQRAWNTFNTGRFDIPFGRFKPYVEGMYSNTKDRPGYEIDSRARLRESMAGIGTEIRLTGKSALVTGWRHSRFEFDQNDLTGQVLASALDRTSDNESLQLKYTLTPLTTWLVNAEAIQDRFFSPDGFDTNSIRVSTGFDLKPAALISGHVLVGYRGFNELDPAVPDYQGVVAQVSSSYSVRATRFEGVVQRDLEYSFTDLHPYYVLTNVGLTVTQRITDKWDLVGRGSGQRLAYVSMEGLPDVPPDHLSQFGGGTGYHVGRVLRVGFDVNYVQRHSDLDPLRHYQGLRAGASLSYGLPQ